MWSITALQTTKKYEKLREMERVKFFKIKVRKARKNAIRITKQSSWYQIGVEMTHDTNKHTSVRTTNQKVPST